jgi:hypothetical protein
MRKGKGRSSKQKLTIVEALFLLVTFLISFSSRLFFLFQKSLAYGIDGAWYLLKTEEFLKNGFFADTSIPPLFFWISSTIAHFTDTTSAVKITAALTSSFMVFTLYFLVKYLYKRKDIACLAVILTLFSFPFLRLIDDLLKNALAMVFVPLFLYFFLKASEKIIYLPLAFLTLVLIGGSHPVVLGFALLTLVIFLISEAGFFLKLSKKRFINFSIIIGTLVILGLPWLFRLLSSYSSYLASPEKSRFLADVSGFVNDYGYLFLLAFLGAIISFSFPKGIEERDVYMVSWLLLCYLLSQPFLVSPSPRLRWMAFLPIAILSAYFLIFILQRLGKLIGVIIIAVVLFTTLNSYYSYGLSMRPIINPEEVTYFKELKRVLPDNSLVIAQHNGFEYWLEYLTEVEVRTGHPKEVLKEVDLSRPIFFFFVERGRMQKTFIPPGFSPWWEKGRFKVYILSRRASAAFPISFRAQPPQPPLKQSPPPQGLKPQPPPHGPPSPGKRFPLPNALDIFFTWVTLIFASPILIFNLLPLENVALLKILLGLPLTFLFWSFIGGRVIEFCIPPHPSSKRKL